MWRPACQLIDAAAEVSETRFGFGQMRVSSVQGEVRRLVSRAGVFAYCRPIRNLYGPFGQLLPRLQKLPLPAA